jgi:3-hydroxyisobutyrate dehydrogenase-like beta-hydroxyacid dehydrogenase
MHEREDGTERTVGFVGLGIMGLPAAKNLIDAGYELVVNDVVEERVAEAEAYGAVSRETPAAVAEVSDVLITFLPEGEHVREVTLGEEGVVEGAHDGLVVIDMSTIGPDAIREVAAELDAVGVPTIDAPVSGGEPGAVAGTMSIMIGGDEALVEAHRDLFEVMGGKVTRVGESGAGQAAKVCNNIIVASEAIALSEAMVFADQAGVDRASLVEAMRGGAAQTWALEHRADDMVDGDLDPGFFGSYMYKDLRIAMGDAETYGAALPSTAVAHELYKTLEQQGKGDLDFTAVLTVVEELSGLEPTA